VNVSDSQRIEKIKEQGNLPRHIALIMDGNGRWAKARGLSRIEGHKEGIKSVRAVVETAGALNLHALTLYTFSIENWSRPRYEVSALMSLLLRTVKNEVNELDQKNVRLMTIGNLNALPFATRKSVEKTIARLSKNTGLIVNLALSYSGREEIVQALKQICQKIVTGDINMKSIDEQLVSENLQTHEIGDPDLLIRTSGEMRISNFLLWQLAYTEFYITPILWPDFRQDDFLTAIESYQSRERRFGKVSEQLK
jgi:undecaprenyl diphosphate synthase